MQNDCALMSLVLSAVASRLRYGYVLLLFDECVAVL